MNLNILSTAPLAVIIHATAATFCILLGGYMLYAKKGTGAHKVMGWTWVGGMSIVVFSALFINGIRWIGPFGPIHLLIPVTVIGIWGGIRDIRAKKVQAHRDAMRWVYWAALGIPLALALLPGRRLNTLFFGDDANMVPTIVLAIMLTLVGACYRWERQLKNLILLNRHY